MTLVDYESELVEALAKSAVFFASSDDKPGQLSLIEYVPKAMCAKLVTQANLLLGTLRDSGNGQKNFQLKLEIYEFCSSVPLANLSPHQVNEERATRIRNSGASVLLIVPPGPTFPSIGSAFQGTSYRELLRLAANSVRRESENRNLELLQILDIEEWLNDSDPEIDFSEGWAYLVTMICRGANRVDVGRELWRVGLIPDIGLSDEGGDFTSRLQRNREIVRSLSGIVRGKKLIDRLGSANVGITPTTKKVLALLDNQILANPAGESGWCHQLKRDELTLDKWDLEPDTGDLEKIQVIPFRDLAGKVRTETKLKQDEPKSFTEALFAEIHYNDSGEVVRPPSVVVEWTTKPVRAEKIGKWRVSLVIPRAYRRPDQDPLLVKTIRGSLRKQSLRLDISRDDLPDGVFGSSLLVAVEVAAISEVDELVMRLASGHEALDESEEFEIRFDEVESGDEQGEPLADDAVSPAMAILDVAISDPSAPFKHVYVLRPEKSLLELQFLEPNSEKAAVRAIRSIRVIPKLVEIQQQILTSTKEATHIELSLNPSESLTISENVLTCPQLPRELLLARSRYFAEIRSSSKTPNTPLVETVEWDNAVSQALDEYLEIYRSSLESGSPTLVSELLLLDTVHLRILGSARPLLTTVILPTHPLRSSWIRDYWVRLNSWTQSIIDFEFSARPQLVDMNLAERISPGNLPFVVRSADGRLSVYAAEIAFGHGIYVGPEDSDHDAMITSTIEVLGSARSRAMQSGRLAAVARNVDNYVEQRRHRDALAIAALNVGDGDVIGSLFNDYFAEETDSTRAKSEFRLEVTAYSDERWTRRPAQKLAALQTKLSDISREDLSHLSPLIGLAVKTRDKLTTDNHSVHLSIVQGIATGSIEAVGVSSTRKTHLNGLLTGTETIHETGHRHWHVVPTGGGQSDSLLTKLHNLYLSAHSRLLDMNTPNIGLTIKLTPETASDLRALHDRSDRVITLDRYVGLDWFIKSKSLGLGSSYILDFTPDFVEGLADRMIVTTQHPAEADRIVELAMLEMGLVAGGRRSQVIDNLNLVSGRLVLRLMTANPQAHETVGLAVVTAVLRNEGDLARWFVIPVDAHLEIFGYEVFAAGHGGRRCDMLLVAMDDDSISIRCVEVKERRALPISDQLRHRIREQLISTEATIGNRYFPDSNQRIDHDLQMAHFSSILHHYIRRSHDHGLITAELASRYQSLADNIRNLKCNITKEAFVVSIESAPRAVEVLEDFTIRYLTSADLELTAFSSTQDANRRTREQIVLESSDGGLSGSSTNNRSNEVREEVHDSESKSEVELANDVDSRNKTSSREATAAETLPKENDAAPEVVSEELETAVGLQREDTNSVLVGGSTNVVTVELGIDAAGQPVIWELSTKGSPHAFVLGITGQGKSVTTRHVISAFAEQGLPALVIDIHGDMALNPPKNASVLDVRTGGLGFSPFYLDSHTTADISENAFEIAEVFSYVCDLGEMQMANVFKAIKEVYHATGWVDGARGDRLPTIDEFAKSVETIETGMKGKNARERLLPLTDFGLFKNSAEPFDPRGKGGGLVIDLHRFKLEQVIRAATSLVLRKVYRDMFLWPQDSTLKLAIVLDEAHRMSKDPTLPKLLKEGRKYGVACFVASQSISDFDDDVKNNSGTKIVFRTNFPESKDVAGLIRGGEKIDFAKQIEQLKVGEAFVSTSDISRARKCKMHGRVT